MHQLFRHGGDSAPHSQRDVSILNLQDINPVFSVHGILPASDPGGKFSLPSCEGLAQQDPLKKLQAARHPRHSIGRDYSCRR